MTGIDHLSVSCIKCGAKKNRPCVYLWPKDQYGVPRVRYAWVAAGMQALMDRAGTPTKKPHTERITKARWAYEKAAREAEETIRKAVHGPRDAVLRANAEALKREQEQLVAWLKGNARILIIKVNDGR